MILFYSFNFILVAGFAIFFYRAGQFDNAPGLLWAILSIVISLLIWRWLRWGSAAIILGQVLLYVGIGVFRMMRKSSTVSCKKTPGSNPPRVNKHGRQRPGRKVRRRCPPQSC
jgi:hypothetical protein